MIAGYDPTMNLFYASIYCLLKEPSTLQILIQEIRQPFCACEDINNLLAALSYLQAVIQESACKPACPLDNLVGVPVLWQTEFIPAGGSLIRKTFHSRFALIQDLASKLDQDPRLQHGGRL